MRLKNDLVEVYGQYATYYNKAQHANYVIMPAAYLKRVGKPKRLYVYRVGDTLRYRPDNILSQLIIKLADYDLPDEVVSLINEL